jgi:hypothetical protein
MAKQAFLKSSEIDLNREFCLPFNILCMLSFYILAFQNGLISSTQLRI